MIELKENQRLDFINFNGKYYACISNEKGLESFQEVPFVYLKEGKISLGIKSMQEAYEGIKKLNLIEEVENIRAVEDFSILVDRIMRIQEYEWNIQLFNRFVHDVELNVDLNFLNGTEMVAQSANKTMGIHEELFKTIASKVPPNWAYAMFPESSWTGYDFLVDKHKIAIGNMTRDAQTVGITKKDAQDKDRQTREMFGQDMIIELKIDTHKYEKIFDGLDLQLQILREKEEESE